MKTEEVQMIEENQRLIQEIKQLNRKLRRNKYCFAGMVSMMFSLVVLLWLK